MWHTLTNHPAHKGPDDDAGKPSDPNKKDDKDGSK